MKTSRVVLLLLLFIATICLFVSCKNEPPEVKHYSVCFYFLDEGCAYSYQTVEAGKKAVRPEDPTKAEFVFDNWYRDTSLTQVYDFNSPVNSDMTLYTKWKVAEKYSVTYNGNGA
ncbi:MAG: InlB B-repeat-containing protein, partial [Sphaerochaetaceae bacterium]|nr:InlB B-repeat-containing protein [Sphaerochaetaceae bacterium]